MGLGGHVLGPRRLAWLSRRTGLPLRAAYRQNHRCEGMVWVDEHTCRHYSVDWDSGAAVEIADPEPWLSCPPGSHDHQPASGSLGRRYRPI